MGPLEFAKLNGRVVMTGKRFPDGNWLVVDVLSKDVILGVPDACLGEVTEAEVAAYEKEAELAFLMIWEPSGLPH